MDRLQVPADGDLRESLSRAHKEIFELKMQLSAASCEAHSAAEARERAEKRACALRSTVAFLRQQQSPEKKKRKREGCDDGEDGGDEAGVILRLKEELDAARREASEIRAKHEAEHAESSVAATALIGKENEAKRDLSEEVNVLKNGLFAAEKESAEIKVVLESEKRKRSRVKAALEREKKEALELKNALSAAKDDLAEAKEALELDRKKLSCGAEELGRVKSALDKEKQEASNIRDSFIEAEKNSARIKAELEVCRKNLNISTEEVAEMKAAFGKEKKKVLKLKNALSTAEKDAAEAKAALESAETKSRSNSEEVKRLKAALTKANEGKEKIVDEVGRLKDELAAAGSTGGSFHLPRITKGMNVSTLKAEAKERGQKSGDVNKMKKAELQVMVKVGTIHLAEVKRLMKVEENPEAEAARVAEEERKKQAKLSRQKDEREKNAAEKAKNNTLLSRQTPAHACPLGPTASLTVGGIARSCLHITCDIGLCSNPRYLAQEEIQEPQWSCLKCNFDICPFCLEVMSLPEAEQRAKLNLLEKKIERKQDEKRRALEEKWAWVQDVPDRIKRPKLPTKTKRRFAVMVSKGLGEDSIQVGDGYDFESDISKQFDSAFEELDDANLRAKHVFYCLNRFGEAAYEFGEKEDIVEDCDDDGTVMLACGDPHFAKWKVFAIPYCEYDQRLKEQKTLVAAFEKKKEREALEKKKREEHARLEELRREKERNEMLKQVGDAPKRIRNPPAANRDPSKGKGFTVWTSSDRGRGEVAWKDFDASFSSKKDANLRAQYLFYAQERPWGGDEDDLSDTDVHNEERDGMVKIVHSNENSSYTWTVAVVPDEAYGFADEAAFDPVHQAGTPKWSELSKLPARIKNPPASNKTEGKKKKFTVWKSCGYAYDGWHSYEGPPAKEFDSSYDTVGDANKRAEYHFFVKNPWGSGERDENIFCGYQKAHMKGLLRLCVAPDDSEVWTVGVVPSVAFDFLND